MHVTRSCTLIWWENSVSVSPSEYIFLPACPKNFFIVERVGGKKVHLTNLGIFYIEGFLSHFSFCAGSSIYIFFGTFLCCCWSFNPSLCCLLRHLEVVGTRKSGLAKERREGRGSVVCLPHSRLFSLVPTTSEHLLRRLISAVLCLCFKTLLLVGIYPNRAS